MKVAAELVRVLGSAPTSVMHEMESEERGIRKSAPWWMEIHYDTACPFLAVAFYIKAKTQMREQ